MGQTSARDRRSFQRGAGATRALAFSLPQPPLPVHNAASTIQWHERVSVQYLKQTATGTDDRLRK